MSEIPVGALSTDDVGARVSLRRRLGAGADQVVGDIIGELETLDADELTIRRSDGSFEVVAAADILAARVVGPSPRAARELEAVSGRGWPAPDDAWLGRWWLRAAEGFTARANSVRPLGDPGVPLDEALSRVNGWYAERDLPTMVRVVKISSINEELGRRAWSSERETIVQTATIAAIRRRLLDVPPVAAVRLASQPTPPWLGRYGADRGITPTALSVLTGVTDVVFATIEGDSGAPAAAIGRASVEAPWVGLAAIEVDANFRRRGYARAVVAGLVEWAAARGATRAYLEVETDNERALALYGSLGFTEHHRYTYRRPS